MNRKVGFLLFLVVCQTVILRAQAPSWAWARSAGGTTQMEKPRGIAVDKAGNVYVAGAFTSSSITFGATTFPNAGEDDIFVAKYDAVGNVVWARTYGGQFADNALGLGLDSSGNCYVAGHFILTLNFGNISLYSNNSQCLFLVKFDTTGTPVWAKQGGPSSGGINPANLAVDAGGASYITGVTSLDPITFGTTTLTSAGGSNYDAFVVKYDAAGNVVWAKRPAGLSAEEGVGIAADKDGSCYVTGSFDGSSIDFGPVTLTNPGLGVAMFTVKYDAAGNVAWAHGSSLTGPYERGMGVAADNLGNSYVTGFFFAPSIGFGTQVLNSAGETDVFLVKYDAAGNVVWAKSVGGATEDRAADVVLDNLGNCYVTGQFIGHTGTFGNSTVAGPSSGNNVFIAKFNDTGAVAWAKTTAGDANSFAYRIAADRAGNCYVTGIYGATGSVLSFDTANLACSGSMPLFVAKLGSATPQSVAEAYTDRGFSVYPNPAGKLVRVRFRRAAAGRVIVSDLAGRVMLCASTAEDADEMMISTGELPAGMYLLVRQTALGTEMAKIMKE